MMFDKSFGHWIAGLTDGEGCFEFRLSKEKKFRPRFSIQLRADDADTLFSISRALGCGDIYPYRKLGKNLQLAYVVCDVDSLHNIILPLFEEFRLRSKKAHEYEVFKAAIKLMYQITRRPKINTRWGYLPRYTKVERIQLAEYAKELKDLKRYQAEKIEIPIFQLPEQNQLCFAWERR